MKVRFFYDSSEETKSLCYVYCNDETQENLEKVKKCEYFVIDLEKKEVQNIHTFFQRILTQSIVDNSDEQLELEDEDIKGFNFYEEEAFKKLMDHIDEQVSVVNATINDIVKNDNSS